jgi:hypothetical protein
VARQATAIIEIAGLEASSLAQLERLPSVESVVRRGGLVEVIVAAARSDEILRELLAWDGVHVRSVRPTPEAGPQLPETPL